MNELEKGAKSPSSDGELPKWHSDDSDISVNDYQSK
jgi:hypothetical protein